MLYVDELQRNFVFLFFSEEATRQLTQYEDLNLATCECLHGPSDVSISAERSMELCPPPRRTMVSLDSEGVQAV